MAMPTKAQIRARAEAALENQETYAERLVKVRKAIDALLLSGQSVSYEGRNLQMANLSELRKLETEYANQAALELQKKPARSRTYYPTPVT